MKRSEALLTQQSYWYDHLERGEYIVPLDLADKEVFVIDGP